jgi:hypothetical protein
LIHDCDFNIEVSLVNGVVTLIATSLSNNQLCASEISLKMKEYQSYLGTREPVRADQSRKETLYTANQVHMISSLASLTPRKELRQELFEQVNIVEIAKTIT